MVAANVVKRAQIIDGARVIVQGNARIAISAAVWTHCTAIVAKANAAAAKAEIDAAIKEETASEIETATHNHEHLISTLYEAMGDLLQQINALKAERDEIVTAIRAPYADCQSVEDVHELAEAIWAEAQIAEQADEDSDSSDADEDAADEVEELDLSALDEVLVVKRDERGRFTSNR